MVAASTGNNNPTHQQQMTAPSAGITIKEEVGSFYDSGFVMVNYY